MSTLQPPVQITPSQGVDSAYAFINQNFQSLATFLQADYLKVVKSGTTSVSGVTLTRSSLGVSQGGNTVTIAHGLPYTPAVIAFGVSAGSYFPITGTPISISSNGNSIGYDILYVEVDATNIYVFTITLLQVFVAGSITYGPSGPYSVKYYLLQETAN